MSYLVDTNVVSELAKRRPEPWVMAFFRATPNEALHLSVLTLGELRRGIEGVPERPRREDLRLWLEVELPRWFGPRVLPVDQAVAERWGRLTASVGRSLPAIDSLLAATALQHDLRLVTRNTRDFAGTGVEVIDPWKA